MSSKKILILNSNDNVGIVISNITKGDVIFLNEEMISATSDVSFGHKIALKELPVGTIVKKYGVPIGVTTTDINPGDHIHVHNIESLYMKQYTK
ncbi:UxaA family hydrolase [uncultured Maribacter sp.]|uniref:UxaA family hydrolase n=1 Tax=uncultured Maribacter sp. TaxID=431308 RepID=UPI00260CF464|nr:UxaA family hydrolase [uncultured Maribacter sp.]